MNLDNLHKVSVGAEGVAKLKTAASLTDQAICAASAQANLLSLSGFRLHLHIARPEGIMPGLPRAEAQSQTQSRIQIQIQVFQPPN